MYFYNDLAWDAFMDHCDANDLDPAEENFDAWEQDQHDMAEDARAEQAQADAEDRAAGFY